MTDMLEDYFGALERLIKGRPVNVTKGTKITNDSVSLEAGRKKGSIKKSRPIFRKLIEAINAAASDQSTPRDDLKVRLDAERAETMKYRVLWEKSLTQEVSLAKQLLNERQEWAKEKEALTGEKVSSILSRKTISGIESASGHPEDCS